MGMDIPLAAVQRQIASAIDIIIHIGRLRDKSRKILEVVEVLNYEEAQIKTRPLYELRKQKEENRGKWLREAGKKLLSYSTKKNYFQQDIRKYEYVVAFTKAVALLG